MNVDTLIIGAGPAGLMASCFCEGRTLVIERMKAPGRKLLATGGGRCNLTHATDAEGIMAAFGRRARFLSPALQAFPPTAIRAFFRALGVETVGESDGCVFPASQKAADVLAALERASRARGAEIRCGVRALRLVLEPHRAHPSPSQEPLREQRVTGVETDGGTFHAPRVILAAGGQSYPDLGSDGSGFALARKVGLAVVTPVPALAGVAVREPWIAELAGLVLERGGVRLDGTGDAKPFLVGPLLLTHKGISGPPALALSGEIAARLCAANAKAQEVPLRLTFLADRTAADWLARFEGWRRTHGGRSLHNLLSGELPRALATALCAQAGLPSTAAAQAKKSGLEALAAACSNLPVHAVGTEGWNRAMLTRGGVALSELDPRSLACKRIAGLHCAGEVVDVDGPCGGYNLTWAFASGRLAGLSL